MFWVSLRESCAAAERGPQCFPHPRLVHACSVMSDCATPWAVARQAPLSIEFSRQEYCVGCHALLQGIFLTQGSNPCLLCPALAGRFFTTEPLGIPLNQVLPWLPAFTALTWLEVSPRGSSLSSLIPAAPSWGLPSPAAQGPYASQVLGNGILGVGT